MKKNSLFRCQKSDLSDNETHARQQSLDVHLETSKSSDQLAHKGDAKGIRLHSSTPQGNQGIYIGCVPGEKLIASASLRARLSGETSGECPARAMSSGVPGKAVLHATHALSKEQSIQLSEDLDPKRDSAVIYTLPCSHKRKHGTLAAALARTVDAEAIRNDKILPEAAGRALFWRSPGKRPKRLGIPSSSDVHTSQPGTENTSVVVGDAQRCHNGSRVEHIASDSKGLFDSHAKAQHHSGSSGFFPSCSDSANPEKQPQGQLEPQLITGGGAQDDGQGMIRSGDVRNTPGGLSFRNSKAAEDASAVAIQCMAPLEMPDRSVQAEDGEQDLRTSAATHMHHQAEPLCGSKVGDDLDVVQATLPRCGGQQNMDYNVDLLSGADVLKYESQCGNSNAVSSSGICGATTPVDFIEHWGARCCGISLSTEQVLTCRTGTVIVTSECSIRP